MRLISTKARMPYTDTIDRAAYNKNDAPTPDMVGRPNPDGKPVKGATTWYFRGLTSAEEGALTDSMFDMSRSQVTTTDGGENAKVDMGMTVSPSKNRRNRVQLSLVGWDDLWVDDPEAATDGKPLKVAYEAEPMILGGQSFDGASTFVMDMIPQAVLARMEKFVKGLSSVEPGAGKP